MLYKQTDPRWANRKLGRSQYTIGQAGCLLLCLASALGVTPLELNSYLAAVDGFTPDGRVIWEALSYVFPPVRFLGREDYNGPYPAVEAARLAAWVESEDAHFAFLHVCANPDRDKKPNHWIRLMSADVADIPSGIRAVPAYRAKFNYPRFYAYDPLVGDIVLVNSAFAPAGRDLDYAVWGVVRLTREPMYVLLEDDPADISRERFSQVLAGTPLAPAAEACYNTIRERGIRAVVGLAFAKHESDFCRAGVAVRTHNWGNLRRGARADKHEDGWAWYIRREGEPEGGEFVRSCADWADLIRSYVGDGLDDVDSIIRRYAPETDRNKPTAYGDAVKALVASWLGGDR